MYALKKGFFLTLSFLLFASLFGCKRGVDVVVIKEKYAGNGILSWETPTLYSNGDPLMSQDIKGYKVYFRIPSGMYVPENYAFVSGPTASVYVKDLNVAVGEYYFVISAVDIFDAESNNSSEVHVSLTNQ